jgi:hypothetical protein
MTTFYTKARDDAFLAALLRVIEGQVRAAMADHKEWNLPDKAARSIAKRVAGDVAANWSRLDAVREPEGPPAEATVARQPPACWDR